jgi:hypothetical protein
VTVHVFCDRIPAAQGGGQHKANLALLHHVRCAIAPACLGSPQATSDMPNEAR